MYVVKQMLHDRCLLRFVTRGRVGKGKRGEAQRDVTRKPQVENNVFRCLPLALNSATSTYKTVCSIVARTVNIVSQTLCKIRPSLCDLSMKIVDKEEVR